MSFRKYGLVIVSGLVGAFALASSRNEVVEEMDAYYQAQFADLKLIKKGMFGTSRVEMSNISNHAKLGGDPGYKNKQHTTQVAIFGNRGRKLNPSTLDRRYTRIPRVFSGKPYPANELVKLVKLAAAEASKGRTGPFKKEFDGWLLDVRRINLSKNECVSCHKGNKKGDAIALIAYIVRPL